METETQKEFLKQERVNFEKKTLVWLKEVRGKISILLETTALEKFHFHWRGLQSHVFQFETLRMLIYDPLEDSDIYPEGL